MDHEPEISSRLAADLRGLYGARGVADSARDEVVMALVRERAALGARRGRRLRLTRWGLAAAAGLAVGVSAWVAMRPAGGVGGDVNGDGRVDILDALVMARRIDEGTARRGWDVNHDGRVDRADVDAVAMEAVRIGEKKS